MNTNGRRSSKTNGKNKDVNNSLNDSGTFNNENEKKRKRMNVTDDNDVESENGENEANDEDMDHEC